VAEQAFVELLYGAGAHANPVACIEDVSMELAVRRIESFPHSIWQLLSHMNFWMSYELKRIRGEAPPYPAHAAESWPAHSAPANEQEWRDGIAVFKSILEELAGLAVSSPKFLARKVPATHPDHTKRSSSVHAVLWQTLVHNSYHIGQVALLRRALGAWPPRAGGDTW
jgi:uncharacterized damage-inducible protein DinB